MKVILLKNVENVGLPGETAEVKPGHYRNFLLPRGWAVEATRGNLKMLQSRRQKLSHEAETIVKEADEIGAESDLDDKLNNCLQIRFNLALRRRSQYPGTVERRTRRS